MRLSNFKHLISIFVVWGLPGLSAAKTHVVNNGTGNPTCEGTFTTIQAAVNASSPGDIVYVCASGIPYNEQVAISTSISLAGQTGATIQPANVTANFTDGSEGPAAAIILVTPAQSGPALTVNVSGLIVDGSLNGSGGSPGIAGIVYIDASGTIVHNAVKNIELGVSALEIKPALESMWKALGSLLRL